MRARKNKRNKKNFTSQGPRVLIAVKQKKGGRPKKKKKNTVGPVHSDVKGLFQRKDKKGEAG